MQGGGGGGGVARATKGRQGVAQAVGDQEVAKPSCSMRRALAIQSAGGALGGDDAEAEGAGVVMGINWVYCMYN